MEELLRGPRFAHDLKAATLEELAEQLAHHREVIHYNSRRHLYRRADRPKGHMNNAGNHLDCGSQGPGAPAANEPYTAADNNQGVPS